MIAVILAFYAVLMEYKIELSFEDSLREGYRKLDYRYSKDLRCMSDIDEWLEASSDPGFKCFPPRLDHNQSYAMRGVSSQAICVLLRRSKVDRQIEGYFRCD